MHAVVLASTGTVDLASGWSSLWAQIDQGDWSTLALLLTWAGICLIVGAVGKFFWDKRRGGGGAGGSSAVLYASVIGGLLAAPEVLIPAILTVIDLLVNLGVRLVPHVG